MPEQETSVWARWNWKDTGLGRWHAVAEYGKAMAVTEVMPGVGAVSKVDVVTLACGRIRLAPPSETAARPAVNCCPECATLDDLRKNYTPEREPEKVPVTARGENSDVRYA